MPETYEFDIFVSYAGPDRQFADLVVEMLGKTKTGYRTWFAGEQMPLGWDTRELLREGLRKARHAVFVVSPAWLQSYWPNYERVEFVKGSGRALIPLLCPPENEEERARFERNLPEEFNGLLTRVTWERGRDPAGLLWQLVSGIKQQPPGPEAEWAARGRQAMGEVARPEDAVIAPAAASSRETLSCDREPQWGEITDYASRRAHHALFVRGPAGAGHSRFLERIQLLLPNTPRHRTREVKWQIRPPRDKNVFLGAVSRALDEHWDLRRLPHVLRALLSDQDLILIHRPVLEGAFEQEGLVRYYSEWLPELLAQACSDAGPKPSGFLKVIQGVYWQPSPNMVVLAARMAARLGLRGINVFRFALQEWQTGKALSGLQARPHPDLPVVLLKTLQQITREDVENWSRGLLRELGEREVFIDSIMKGARTSEDILSRIAERLG